MCRKYVITILSAIIFFVIIPYLSGRVEAALRATSTYGVNVYANSNGEVDLEYIIHLVNESSGFFIRDYSLSVDHTDLIGLKVLENGGEGDFRKEHIDDKIRIRINLQNQLIRQGDSVDLYIRYTTRQIYKKEGLIGTLIVPPIKTEEELQYANFNLSIPESLGNISYLSLNVDDYQQDGASRIYKYTQADAPSGALVIFGDKQQFDFVYTYKLENSEGEKRRYTINLPVDSDFQEVFFVDTNLLPDRSLSDKNGNNLVEYILNPGETKEIRIAGFTKFYSQGRGRLSTPYNLEEYLRETEIWEFSKDDVKATINNVTRNDFLSSENARLIYEYLLLNFDFAAEQDLQSREATYLLQEKPQLSCINYMDLFITLARGSGIPSRGVIGYSTFTRDFDSLHYWAEFYDERKHRWVALDPCLEEQFGFSEFENLDPARVILGYWDGLNQIPSAIPPFVEFQDNGLENLVVNVSSYEYYPQDQDVDFKFEVGSADLFFRNIPLTFFITNNTHSIFSFEKVLIDNQKVVFMPQHADSNYFESVFPSEACELSINLIQLSSFSVERIENYGLEIFAIVGSEVFRRSYEFEINRPFSWYHGVAWFTAGVLSFISLGIFLLLVKKLRTKPWKDLKRLKYKYKFKRSKMRGMLDVPVSLR